ncbi:FAD-binding oxidoreductase [Streptomyces sp. TRM66268-LWL]|uniref:D-amino-acid oxidase n=1 Tax=Streptomyces polyasparticus TaxID=2767826 RepID=A0ABR7SH46_9ACTN|nr:FAD-dependent oxidoreductase [Streptomyces polyasparticus]MBC9713638.1 FAD-binding oxidoreductase [Streptomyces polyasparticus]
MGAEVIVVGGGVIGLTTAVVLAEAGSRVRVWAAEPAARTTSAVAGAICWPYRIEPFEKVVDWSVRSLRRYEEIAALPRETGVRLVTGVMADESLTGGWVDALDGARAATDLPDGCAAGVQATVPVLDMPVCLRYLSGRLADAGGVVEVRAVTGLAEAAAEAPVVVNCSGLGARALVPDETVYPVRGQLVVVENPGIERWFVAGTDAYVIPHPRGVVLGGTADEHDWRREPDPETAARIVERCARFHPELATARVLEHRVGLRPARPTVRLERELFDESTVLVHNYGHGGGGVTAAWGCAEDVAALLG